MRARFAYEGFVGLIGLIAVLLFGDVGGVSLVLFVFFPVIVRMKKADNPDENELLLFYKTSNFTLILIFVALVLIYVFSDLTINGHMVGESWYLLSISSILFIHGMMGLAVFKKVN